MTNDFMNRVRLNIGCVYKMGCGSFFFKKDVCNTIYLFQCVKYPKNRSVRNQHLFQKSTPYTQALMQLYHPVLSSNKTAIHNSTTVCKGMYVFKQP